MHACDEAIDDVHELLPHRESDRDSPRWPLQCGVRAASAIHDRLLSREDRTRVIPSCSIGAAQDPLFAAPHAYGRQYTVQEVSTAVEVSKDFRRRGEVEWGGEFRQHCRRLYQSAERRDERSPHGLLVSSALPTLHQQRVRETRAVPLGGTILDASARLGMAPPPVPRAAAMTAAQRKRLVENERLAAHRKMARIVSEQDVVLSMLERREYGDFLTAPLDLDVDADSALEPQCPLTPAHVVDGGAWAQLADARSTVRDERGARVVWPWDRLQRDGVNGRAALQAGREHAGGGVVLDHGPQAVTVFDINRSGAYDNMINAALDAASSDGRRGWSKTGPRAWRSFCSDKGISPDRPLEPYAPLMEKLGEEWICMEFICSLVERRGVTPETARSYFSQTQGWHAREYGVKLCGGLKLERLPQMLKGLRRKLGDRGHARPQRRAIAPRQLREALDRFYDPAVPLHANIRAAIACAYAGLLRSAEYCGTTGPNMLLRKDVVHYVPWRDMVVMIHPCKNMHHLEGKTCPLLLGAGGEHIDPVAEYANLLAVDGVTVAELGFTPLFRDPATNAPLSYDIINDACKQMGAWLGFPEAECTSHIMRISGATALFAAGASELMIRTMGRWSSDLHRLYVRCCFEQCRDWSAKLGSVEFTAAAPAFDEVDDY